MPDDGFPSQRPMAIGPDHFREGEDAERSPSVTTIPWIDLHQHTQTISWDDRHKFDLTGCQAAVMIGQNPRKC